MRFVLFTILMCVVFSCKEDVQPKPNCFLRLDYPVSGYETFDDAKYPYSFQYSKGAKVLKREKKWVNVYYPSMNATLMLSYMPVKNNLNALFKDAEKLTFKHMIKADDIQAIPYENSDADVYGKLFEVYGNAATQLQFYATDSVNNFMTGALYFYAKPNYDSIMPAVNHLKKDVVRVMETLEWRR